MKSTIILYFLLCLAPAVWGNEIITPRIRKGKAAAPNQFPYMVGMALSLINIEGEFWGNGALISKDWVLSNANSLYNVKNLTAYLGSNLKQGGNIHLQVEKKDIILHKGFDRLTQDNDIALVRIPGVTFTASIRPIGLPKAGETIAVGSIGAVSGWGFTDEQSTVLTTNLQYADVKIIWNKDCQGYFGGIGIGPGKLCAVAHNGTTCNGDAGSPLVLPNQHILVGIASFMSFAGCDFKAPAGFTRVTYYLNWIKSTAKL